MKILAAILIMSWIIYQAVYSIYAPDHSVSWNCAFYILLYGSIGLSLFCIGSKKIIIQLMFIYAGSYFIILVGRYVYFLKFIGDYDSYYHSLSLVWLQFKIVASLFLSGLIYGIKQWQTNR